MKKLIILLFAVALSVNNAMAQQTSFDFEVLAVSFMDNETDEWTEARKADFDLTLSRNYIKLHGGDLFYILGDIVDQGKITEGIYTFNFLDYKSIDSSNRECLIRVATRLTRTHVVGVIFIVYEDIVVMMEIKNL